MANITLEVIQLQLIPDQIMSILLTVFMLATTLLIIGWWISSKMKSRSVSTTDAEEQKSESVSTTKAEEMKIESVSTTKAKEMKIESVSTTKAKEMKKAYEKKMANANVVGVLVLFLGLVLLGITEIHFKPKINIEKTKDLLAEVCQPSESNKAIIDAHSMQPLYTHASDFILGTIFATAIVIVLVTNSTEKQTDWCRFCFAMLTLLSILSYEHAFVNVFKISLGEPRPHFLSVCKLPEAILAESEECVEIVRNFKGDIFNNFLKEDKEGYCNSKASMSHPSGHSSMAWAISTFSAIQVLVTAIRLFTKNIGRPLAMKCRDLLIKLLIILLVFSLAIQVMNGRVQEHFHTWRNCLYGMAIGTLFSIVFSVLSTIIACCVAKK